MNLISKELLLPIGFVTLYGSGFVFTQYGLENSSPMFFLAIRFFIAFIILFGITVVFKISYPKNIKEFFHIAVAGCLTVGVFSVGVYLSISYSVSASMSALIISLQPLLVTFLAALFLREKITFRVWLGMVIGFLGVAFVVTHSVGDSVGKIYGMLFSLFALLGLSFGNIYQKKFCTNMNIFSGGAIQTFAATLFVIPFLYNEEVVVFYNGDFFLALFYMSVCVSIGALSLLYIMIKKGEVSKVASIFYLVPVVAVIISYLFFSLEVEPIIIIGVVTILIGVSLINKK